MSATSSTFHQADWTQLAMALLNYEKPDVCQDNAKAGQFADILTPLSRAKAGSNWRMVSYLWDKYDTGLKNSRQGKLSTAEQAFAEAQEVRHPFVSVPLLDWLIDVAALPAIAYLHYKKEQYPEAERLLINSIDRDAELLSEGIYILEYHRVQQLHNLARLYFRQDRLEEGARMIATALKFLVYHQIPAVGNGKGWSEDALRQIPDQLRSDMLWQLISETVGVFLMYPDQSYELGQLAFGNMSFWEARTSDEALLLNWFLLTDPGYGNNWQNNLQGTIDFLSRSPSSFDKLKMVLVLEIIAVSNQCMPDTTLLQEGVTHFLSKLQLSQAQRETCRLFVGKLLSYKLLNRRSHESDHIFLG